MSIGSVTSSPSTAASVAAHAAAAHKPKTAHPAALAFAPVSASPSESAAKPAGAGNGKLDTHA